MGAKKTDMVQTFFVGLCFLWPQKNTDLWNCSRLSKFEDEMCPRKCHEEVWSLQPMIPPKRFDNFPPDWGMLRRSRCVQVFL